MNLYFRAIWIGHHAQLTLKMNVFFFSFTVFWRDPNERDSIPFYFYLPDKNRFAASDRNAFQCHEHPAFTQGEKNWTPKNYFPLVGM